MRIWTEYPSSSTKDTSRGCHHEVRRTLQACCHLCSISRRSIAFPERVQMTRLVNTCSHIFVLHPAHPLPPWRCSCGRKSTRAVTTQTRPTPPANLEKLQIGALWGTLLTRHRFQLNLSGGTSNPPVDRRHPRMLRRDASSHPNPSTSDASANPRNCAVRAHAPLARSLGRRLKARTTSAEALPALPSCFELHRSSSRVA